MTIEISVLLGTLSVAVALYFGLATKRRNDRTDAQKEGADMTMVSVKLDFIRTDVSEIKTSMGVMSNESKETRERLIACEQSTKQAHKRLDDLTSSRRTAKGETE